MKARDLRASILQLAVEGRLVEQRPEEGMAAGLLGEVRAERAALVAAGKAKLPKGGESVISRGEDGRFYERRVDARGRAGEPMCIDDEIPFDVPGSWEWARLESVTSVISDGDHQAPPQTTEGVPFLVISDISNGAISFANTRHVPAAYYECITDDRKPLQGDLLFTVTGSFGITVPVNTNEPFCFQRHIALIRPLVWRPFLDCVLTAPSAYGYFKRVATGTAQKTVSLTNLRNTLIPIPPLAEQERIVAKLDELMPLVEEYGRLEEAREQLDAELPERLRKSILQLAVEGRLVEQRPEEGTAAGLLGEVRAERAALVAAGKAKLPKGGESVISRGEDGRFYERRVDARGRAGEPVCIDDEIPFDVPGSWEWARLESVFNLVRGSGIKRSDVCERGMPCIRYGELYTTYVSSVGEVRSRTTEAIYDKAHKLLPDEVLMTLTGENNVDIGRAIFNDTDSEIAVGGDLLLLKGQAVSGAFAELSINSPYMGAQRTRAATGNIIVHLGKDKVGNFLMAVPPLAEQERIVAKAAELLALIDGLTT